MRFVECFWSSEMIVLKSFTWGESNCCFNCFCVAFGLYERAKYRATKRDICCGCCGVKAFVRLLIVSLFHPVIRSEHGTFSLWCSRSLILAFAWIWSTLSRWFLCSGFETRDSIGLFLLLLKSESIEHTTKKTHCIIFNICFVNIWF